jgi:hypothetical protein
LFSPLILQRSRALGGWKRTSSNLNGSKMSAAPEQVKQLEEEEGDVYLCPLLKYSRCSLSWGGLFDPSMDRIIRPAGDFGLPE